LELCQQSEAASAAFFHFPIAGACKFKHGLNLPRQTHDVMFIGNSISMISLRA
jgi:hypothetical protein